MAEDSGKPVANEIIHKADMDGFVTKVDWMNDTAGNTTIKRYYYETASGDTYPFVSSIKSLSDGEKSFLVEKQAVTAGLANKVNTSDVLALEEIQASTDLTGKVASAKSARDIDSYLKKKKVI